jgi:hypothetical protein
MSKLMRGVIATVVLMVSIVASYWFIVRPWHLHWGATPEEVRMTFPGDKLIAPDTLDISTRAITIHAPASLVWQWLVQIGQDRAGFYSYHWLENLFAADMRNGDQIKPEWQDMKVGRKVLLAYYGASNDAMTAPVTLVDPGRALVLGSGWGMYLFPTDTQTTRLIVRYPLDPKVFGVEPLSYGIFEAAHFVMESGMMLGIKERAEGTR